MSASKYQSVLDKYRSPQRSLQIQPEKIRRWIEINFQFKERRGGEELLICNPFSGDSNFKFNINPAKASCHCWTGDEWAGPVNPDTGKRNCSFLKFVKLFRKCSYAEAVREVLGTGTDIAAYLRPENRRSPEVETKQIVVALPSGTERLADNQNDPQAAIVTTWLKKRGYSLEDIDKNDIHYLGVDCYWIYYEFDAAVYWQSRNRFNKVFNFPPKTVYDKKGVLIGETDGSKGDFLYGFDDCDSASYINITEAIFGKHTLGPQSLASGGAVLTSRQIGKIKILGPRDGVVLSPDNDKAGINSIFTNAQLLNGYKLFYSIPPKIPYQKNGEMRHIKDWNELVEELKYSNDDVRKLHNELIKPINSRTLMKLRQQVGR